MFEVIDRPGRRAIITPVARLDFILAGDRWTHRLSASPAGEEGPPIASSVEAPESAGPRSDPPSPTYQEVTLAVRDDEVQAFCLGQFGPNHYATAFAVRRIPGEPGGRPPATIVEVDIAARREASGRPLAATYTVHWPPSSLAWAAQAGARWEAGDPPLSVALERRPGGPEGHMIQVDEAGRAACRAQMIAPGDPADRTNRLMYTWLISGRSARPG